MPTPRHARALRPIHLLGKSLFSSSSADPGDPDREDVDVRCGRDDLDLLEAARVGRGELGLELRDLGLQPLDLRLGRALHAVLASGPSRTLPTRSDFRFPRNPPRTSSAAVPIEAYVSIDRPCSALSAAARSRLFFSSLSRSAAGASAPDAARAAKSSGDSPGAESAPVTGSRRSVVASLSGKARADRLLGRLHARRAHPGRQIRRSAARAGARRRGGRRGRVDRLALEDVGGGGAASGKSFTPCASGDIPFAVL